MLYTHDYDKDCGHLERRKAIKFMEAVQLCMKQPLLWLLRVQELLYVPLPHMDWIRLLQIHPGKPGETIKCSLHLTRLDGSTPPYEALSYVWLLRAGIQAIICNGHKKIVPTNLHDALERLRYRDKSRWLWVDNVCIAQEDSLEKNQQIRRMNHVYRRASRVIVWLGTDEKDEAHPTFATLCTFVNAHREGDPVSYSTLRGKKLYCVPCTHSAPPRESNEWYFVASFFTNKWWLRMWVLQEIVLARSATVIWGCAEVDWSIIGEAIDLIRQDDYLYILLESRALQNGYVMNSLVKYYRNREPSRPRPSFLQLLDLARSFDVTFAKDKVYGLLGFPNCDDDAEDSESESVYSIYVPREYDRPVAEIYTHVARQILLRDGNLNLLAYTSHTDPSFSERQLELPSWVPDWNSKDIVWPLLAFRKYEPVTTEDELTTQPYSFPAPEVLALRAAVLDTITDTFSGPAFVEVDEYRSVVKAMMEWCISISTTTSTTISPESPPSSTLTISTLAKTLTANQSGTGKPLSTPEQTIQHLYDFAALSNVVGVDLPPSAITREMWKGAGEAVFAATWKGDAYRARRAAWRFGAQRTAFWTEGGRLGLGPRAARKGDLVVKVGGDTGGSGGLGLIRKRAGEGESYVWVGEAYVRDFEAEGEGDRNGVEERVFELR